MYDDFHQHLVETNLKTQASNMHEKFEADGEEGISLHFYGGKTQDF